MTKPRWDLEGVGVGGFLFQCGTIRGGSNGHPELAVAVIEFADEDFLEFGIGHDDASNNFVALMNDTRRYFAVATR